MKDVNFDTKLDNYLNKDVIENKTKCAIIVTDKQCAMLIANDKNIDATHSNLISYIEQAIHPSDETSGWLTYKLHDAYLLLEGPELMINLPLDGNLSVNQACFIIDIIDKICKFNLLNDDMISIDVISTNDYQSYRTHTINTILKHIISLITKDYVTQDEIIIGKTDININNIKRKVYEKH